MSGPRFSKVGAIAASQHGLITSAQLRGIGVPGSTEWDWIASGLLRRDQPGVAAIAGAPATWRQAVLACCLGGGGVASHRAAAQLLGLQGPWRDVVEITVPRGTFYRRRGIIAHQSTDFDKIDVVQVDGIPTTSAGRLMVDLGGVVPAWAYERTFDQAVVERRLSHDAALRVLAEHARRGRRGVAALRAVLDARLGEPLVDSMLELRFLRLLERSGLPLPTPQVELFDDGRFVMRLDFGYPEARVGIELDSVAHHLNGVAFEGDKVKRNHARRIGWLIIEVTHRMLVDTPATVVADLAAALRSRGAVR